jgi:D-alanyl-D-alanine carboxypeptidase
MPGTLHSKGFQAITIFFIASLCGISSAFNAYGFRPLNEDSARATTLTTPFIYEPDSTVYVDPISLKAGLLYDVQNQKIVWQKDMHKTYPIASLTKMMVALLTVEDIHAGKVRWEDEVAWTRDVHYWVKKKKVRSTSDVTYTLLDLFKNSMIASNNEASEQMARYVGEGNLDAFIQRMNVRARELGMMSTYYGNPTGLPSYSRLYDNASTPTDLLMLTLEMLKYPEIIDVTRMDYADISCGKKSTTISNHNRLAIDFKGQVDGMKTGYTKRAGFCLVASSYKCDHRLISIVLGSRAPGTRNDVVRGMFDDYYTAIGLDKLSPYCQAPEQFTTAGSTDNEDAAASEGAYVYQTKIGFFTHKVKRGEYLSYIAGKYKVTVPQLKKWNHLRSTRLHPGQRLVVKGTIRQKVWVTKEDQNSSVPKKTIEAKSPAIAATQENYIFYTVQQGDTLFSISRQHNGISIDKLKELNNIADESCITPGMKLKVPKG